jgi:hypothetical protein
LQAGRRLARSVSGIPVVGRQLYRAEGIPRMMVSVYHRQYIPRIEIAQKRVDVEGPLRARVKAGRLATLAVLLLIAACDPVQIIEGSDTHVSIRYDGVMNGLDQATKLAKTACAGHGKTAKLRKTYYEGLGAGERFAFFDCV